MTLQELLDELRGNLLRDTSTLKNGPPDHYWSDESLVLYINNAHRRFARRALCLRDDTTPEVVQFNLVAGKNVYTLHPSILRVMSARHQDSNVDLVRITHMTSFTFSNPNTDYLDYATTSTQGEPKRFATDEGVEVGDEHQVRMFIDPTPNADQTDKIINLRVIRLPLEPLTIDGLTADAEIPEDWQLDMLEWAAWRALRNWDVDAEAVEKAERHRKRFDEAVAECLKEVQQQKMFEPATWKFGGNGYTYTR